MGSNKKNIVIIGATSAIAEHCARSWVYRGADEFTLVGRDVSRLERIAADLKVRSVHCKVRVVQAGFLDPVDIRAAVDAASEHGAPDIVLIAHGALPEQEDCQG